MVSLVIGASGQVGQCVMAELALRGVKAVGTCYSRCKEPLLRLSLDDEFGIDNLVLRLKPEIIFFCASLTHVDYCESNPKASFETNVKGVELVGRAAKDIGSKFVFLSTDYVFNGKSGPYAETDAATPINIFGMHKLLAESTVLKQDGLVARTTWVYSYERPIPGKNFVQRLIESLSKGEEVRVPTDQLGTPTYAPDLAGRLVSMAFSDAIGLVHLTGAGRLSRDAFARCAAEQFGLDANLIKGVQTNALGQTANRPLNSGLRSIRTTSLHGFRTGLQRMYAEMKKDGIGRLQS